MGKGKKIFLIILFLVLLMGIGGYLYTIKNDNSKSDEKENIVENIEPDNGITIKDLVANKEQRSGKKITIYKLTDKSDKTNFYYSFSSKEDEDFISEEVGKVTCFTKDCEGAHAFSNYVIVEDSKGAYLLDYRTDELLYGPFGAKPSSNDEENDFPYDYASDDNKLTLVSITENNESIILDMIRKKEIQKFKGQLIEGPNDNISEAIEKGYLYLTKVTEKNDDEMEYTYYLYDLIHGRLLMQYNHDIELTFYNDEPYVLESSEGEDVFYTIYDINGKKLFNGKQYTDVNVENKNLVLSTANQFFVYDKNLKLVKESKKYTSVIMAGKDFILVNNNNKLQLIDLDDKLLTTFITNYNDETYYVHTMLSGWYTENGKNGIYFVIQGDNVKVEEVLKANPDMTKEELGGLDYGYEYYYIPATKETGRIATYIGGYAKPVLYLYPKKKTKVEVTFLHSEFLTTTYPKFDKKWNVDVSPDGNMTDAKGRNYYGLYWEEVGNHRITFDTGFYVEGKDAIEFLEDKLDIIGFTEREANEFIMYWLPILEKNKKNLVYFELTEERDSYNKLVITPKPDSILRVAIHVKKVDSKVKIKKQQLKTFKRKGFSVVEWGGVEY